MPEFVLNVHDIDEAGKDYSFALEPSWMKGALEGTELTADPTSAAGHVELHVQRSGRDIVLQGRLRASLFAPCCRCLNDTRITIDTELGSLLSPRRSHVASASEVELSEDEIEHEYFSGDRIVLDDHIRQQLLLEVPMKPLCAEDCAGIPVPAHVGGTSLSAAPSSSRAEEVDPRLLPLMNIALQGAGKKKE